MGSGIVRLIQERAARDPSGLALIEGRTGRVLANGAVAAAVEEWVTGAESARLRGRPVVLTEARPVEFICAYLGLLAAGAVVLPVDPLAPDGDADLDRTIAGFDVAAVVTGAPNDLQLQPGAGPPAPVAWAEPGTILLRTSGTTGAPKGVPLAEARLLEAAGVVARHHALGPADVLYSSLPLFHINAQVVGVLACLVSGAALAVDDRFHRRGFWDVIDRCGTTVLNAVPAIFAILGDQPPPPKATAQRIRFARSASAPLAVATLGRFEQRCGVGVLETYGMTEAAGQICANPLDPTMRHPGSVGLPVGIELRVVDEKGGASPPEVPGLVQIRGATVTDSYVIPGATEPPRRRPAAPGGWLPTGDVAYRDADGFVYLMGRTDGVINRGGEKLYPREVEEVLRRHPGVAEAAVVGEPDEVLGECPVAFVVPRSQETAGTPLEAELVDLCRRELSRHKRPSRIHLTATLPSTATGKVRRDQLRALAPR